MKEDDGLQSVTGKQHTFALNSGLTLYAHCKYTENYTDYTHLRLPAVHTIYIYIYIYIYLYIYMYIYPHCNLCLLLVLD